MGEELSILTDIEVVNLFCEKSLNFINPTIFNEIRRRGLYDVINYLPKGSKEAKAVAYARLSKLKKVFNDDEIDIIAGKIQRLETLRKELNQIKITDVHELITVLNLMSVISEDVKNYFK